MGCHMKKIEVVAAVFENEQGEYYCARRKPGGELSMKWEFPGGKIESGESHEQALIREIKEELNLTIEIKTYFMTVKHQYKTFFLTMHIYKANIIEGKITLLEHIEQKWLNKKELLLLDWADADIPIVNKLLE
jgi:8-oxo-dGTP diphosphatase